MGHTLKENIYIYISYMYMKECLSYFFDKHITYSGFELIC